MVYIETSEEDDCENWSDEQWKAWLASNPPIPIEDDPTISPKRLERLRKRFRDIDDGKAKVVSFTPEQLEEFWQEMEHSPEEAKAKARSRAHYPTTRRQETEVRSQNRRDS